MGGMAVFGSNCEMAITNWLLVLSPTVITGPSSVPLSVPARVSRLSPARGRLPLWQRTHDALNSG